MLFKCHLQIKALFPKVICNLGTFPTCSLARRSNAACGRPEKHSQNNDRLRAQTSGKDKICHIHDGSVV